MGDGLYHKKMQSHAPRQRQPQTGILHGRPTAGNHGQGAIHRSTGGKQSETGRPVRQGGHNGQHGARAAGPCLPLQGPPYLRQAVHPIRKAAFRICIASLVPWSVADIQTLERVQKRAVTMVSGLRAADYEGRLKDLGLLSLEERRHQIDMTQTFQIINGHDNVNIEQWFTFVRTEGAVTRRAADPLNLVQSRSRLELRRNFF